ncbi:MAG: DUF4397 domain-containing protein [Chloroflexi bacterium]|nr:DUF4397 domain-containing protein [Chloroflexota bacterium]
MDIRHDDGTLLDNFDDIEYLSATTYITLPTGSYDLHLSDATSTTTLFDLPTLPLTEGQIATVYALGDIANQPLDVLVISSTTTVSAFAHVQFAHFAPFTGVLTSTAVSVILNNPMTTTVISDVMYGQTSDGYLHLAAGLPTDIQVIPTGSVTPAISTTLVFSPDVHYTLAAIGNGTDQPFNLLVITDDLSAPMTDTFKLRVVHVAPFSNTITGTLLDVRDQSGTLLDSLGDLTYESVSTYLTLPVSILDLQLTQPGGSPTLYDILPLSFNGGQVVTLFAIGDTLNQPLSTLVITNRQGLFRYILPLVYKEAVAIR